MEKDVSLGLHIIIKVWSLPQRMSTLPYFSTFHSTTPFPWREITISRFTNWNNKPTNKIPVYSKPNICFFPHQNILTAKKLTSQYSICGRFSWFIFSILFSTRLKIRIISQIWQMSSLSLRRSKLLLEDYSYCFKVHIYTIHLN